MIDHEEIYKYEAERYDLLASREDPRAPTRELQAYYAYLEEDQGFECPWIRTDYRFTSLEEAEQTIEFFFGGPLSRGVREEMLTVVPECTGIWWRKL